MASWRFLLYSITGTGSSGETLLVSDLPLTSVSFTRPLSGVGVLSGEIAIESALIPATGAMQRFRPWASQIMVERDGALWGCYLLTRVEAGGGVLKLEAESFVSYLHGTPWLGTDRTFAQTDSTDIAAWLISAVQAMDSASNIGLTLIKGAGTTGTLLGAAPADTWVRFVNTQVATQPATATSIRFVLSSDSPDQVYYGLTGSLPSGLTPNGAITRETSTGKLSWVATSGTYTPASGFTIFGYTISDQMPTQDYVTAAKLDPYAFKRGADVDLGQRFDMLAKDGHWDYFEQHAWAGQRATHTLVLTPDTGPTTDRTDLRFEVGVNVIDAPALLSAGSEQFTSTIIIGPGDGQTAPWARADRPAISGAPRLSRYQVIQDDTATSSAKAAQIATQTQMWNGQLGQISEITVRDTGLAPFGSWLPGDFIWVLGSGIGWAGDLTVRARVLDTKIDADRDVATLTLLTPITS